ELARPRRPVGRGPARRPADVALQRRLGLLPLRHRRPDRGGAPHHGVDRPDL
ncbi:MAG: Transmembrane protein Msl3831, partial [uncultured Acetobacteraceae bacterium]